jgi:hypothetical protein
MVAEKRKFKGVQYTLYPRTFDVKWKAEDAEDRLRSNGFYHFHIMRVESKAPPQGEIFFRLYYRR